MKTSTTPNGTAWRSLIVSGLLLSLVFLAIAPAHAADANGVLGSIDAAYKPLQAKWHAAMKGTAVNLFVMLMAIDFTWGAFKQVMEVGELDGVLKGLGQRVMRYGIFFALLKFSDTWLPAIIKSFIKIGADASGISAASMSPDAIVGKGVDVALGMFQQLSSMGLLDAIVTAIPLIFMSLIIFGCFLFVAIQIVIAQIEIYLVCGASPILLGMGGSTWTKDMATNVYKYAVQVGMKLLLLYLICGVGMSVLGDATIDSKNLIQSTLELMGVSCVFAYLAIKAPALANGMLSGSSSLSAGELIGSSMAVMAGAAAVGGGAVAAGKGGMDAATGLASVGGSALAGAAGLAQAVGAGMNAAHDVGKSGLDAAMHAGAMVGSQGLTMASGAASAAISGGSASFGERVAQSTGGKIAQSIESGRGGSFGPASGGGTPTPGGGQAAPASAPNTSATPQGNAAGASLTGGEAPSVGEAQRSDQSGGGRSLSEKMNGMRDFLPDDAVPQGTAHIDTNAQV